MALKDIFTMVKADKYIADGREELIKAQEAEVEDKTYQIGEISQKTGLQKTANGWVKPKKGNAGSAKKELAKRENNPGYRPEKVYSESKPAAESKPAENDRESRINEYWRKIRKETHPVVRMAAELDRGTFDDDVIDTMGDGQSMEDLARSLISPAYEEDGYIPQEKLDSARKIIRKRYKALESEAIGDAAPRVLTGDTRIRVRKA